jgi:hypothetical protein
MSSEKMTPAEHDAERHEQFDGLCDCLRRIALKSPRYLSIDQCVALAEICRDVADALDAGEGERKKRYMTLVPKSLKAVGVDALGRKLFVRVP